MKCHRNRNSHTPIQLCPVISLAWGFKACIFIFLQWKTTTKKKNRFGGKVSVVQQLLCSKVMGNFHMYTSTFRGCCHCTIAALAAPTYLVFLFLFRCIPAWKALPNFYWDGDVPRWEAGCMLDPNNMPTLISFCEKAICCNKMVFQGDK